MQKNRSYSGLLGLGLFLMGIAFTINYFNAFTLPQIAQKSSSLFEEKASRCKSALLALNDSSIREMHSFYDSELIGLYLFKGDSLLSWNNSSIPLVEGPGHFKKKQGVVHLKHGLYLYFIADSGSYSKLSLCLIKPAFELQNKYLNNNFLEWTGIPEDVKAGSKNEAAISLDGEALLFLEGNQDFYYKSVSDYLSYGFFLGGYLLTMLSLILFIRHGLADTKVIIGILFILVFRALMLLYEWPTFLYRLPLYDVRIFGNAQSFFNSHLGDIFLNACLMLFIVIAVHFYFIKTIKNKQNHFIEFSIVIVLVLIVVNSFNHNLISLIDNSTLSFDFLTVFNLKYQTLLGLASLCIYSMALFLLTYKISGFFKAFSFIPFLKFLGIHLVICIFLLFTFESQDYYFESFWLLAFAAFAFVLFKSAKFSLTIALGVQTLLITGITSRCLITYVNEGEQQELEILSHKLSERRDAVLENEYKLIPEKLAHDKNLANLIQILPVSVEGVEALIKQKYFSGYFDRYNLDFSLFDANCNPLLPVKQSILYNQGYFEDEIRLRADSTSVLDLFFVEKFRKNTRYIAKIKLGTKNLYVFMEAKQFEELGSFPDLFLDRSQQKNEKLQSLSHAVYRSQQLTGRYGDLNYPFVFPDSVTFNSAHPEFSNNYFEADDGAKIIISAPSKTWTYFFTFNSYLLLFFSIITYSSYVFYAIIFTKQFRNPSLTRRIQTIIIGLLFLAMSAIGLTSGNLVSDQFERDNNKLLEEKTQVIINELSTQFTPQQFFDDTRKELINLKLREYSRLFNTPISLFDKSGVLFNTSEAKLYDFGLSSKFANPKAFENLKNNYASSQSVTENAGSLSYLSFYTPLFNNKKELLGFVNLPYFAKQSALAKELSGIISALINVYVILFVISIIAGLILAGYITQPLRLIQQQIANISLGKQNEKISWRTNDEIGKLVSEYNQMLVKLENSVNLLARSERESAWREMAKQVAHEIKNPLTPMKLNLQYLLHVMKNEPGDFREKFEKTSKGIIEQIDSLANIASEFSNFAKLPATDLQAINLIEVISASLLLFENQKGISFINHLPPTTVLVKGDRDQCLRVFNNIIKNAVQALENCPEPTIELLLKEDEATVTIAVKDNGCGINEDLKERLFMPNFTTKTTGSGLGLAMVKNIMEGFEGEVWFESEVGIRSIFYVKFKKEIQ